MIENIVEKINVVFCTLAVSILILIVSSCSIRGPLRMEMTQVSPFADRLENSEVICYLVGTSYTSCKWKDGSLNGVKAIDEKIIAKMLLENQ